MRFARLIPAVALATLLPVAVFASEAKEQADLFKKNCASCHGADGSGQTPVGKSLKIKDLHSADVQKESKEALTKIISDGKGKMPAFKTKLNKEQIEDVIGFVHSLKK